MVLAASIFPPVNVYGKKHHHEWHCKIPCNHSIRDLFSVTACLYPQSARTWSTCDNTAEWENPDDHPSMSVSRGILFHKLPVFWQKLVVRVACGSLNHVERQCSVVQELARLYRDHRIRTHLAAF